MGSAAASEEWNQEQLATLEDQIYQNKRNAIEVRNKREIDSIKGKAAEYGKQAKFWEKFSTTYAKQWGELAQGAVDLSGKLEADAYWDQMTDRQQLEWDNFEQKGTNYILKSANGQAEIALKDRKYDLVQSTLRAPSSNAQRFLSKRWAGWVKDNWDVIAHSIQSSLDKEVKADGVTKEYTKDDILELYPSFVKALLEARGVTKGQSGYHDAMDFVRSKSNALWTSRDRADKYRQSNELKRVTTENFLTIFNKDTSLMSKTELAAHKDELKTLFETAVKTEQTSWRKGPNNTIVSGIESELSPAQAILELGKRLIEDKAIKTYEDIALFYDNVDKKYYSEKNLHALKETLKTVSDENDNHLKKARETKNDKDYDDIVDRTTNKNREDYIDVDDYSPGGGRETLFHMLEKYPNNKKIRNYIAGELTLDLSKADNFIISNQLKYASRNVSNSSDQQFFRMLYERAPAAVQKQFLAKYTMLANLRWSDVDEIRTNAKLKVNQEEKNSVSNKQVQQPHRVKIIGLLVNETYKNLEILSDENSKNYIANIDLRVKRAIELANASFEEGKDLKGSPFRRTVLQNGTVTWLAFTSEDNTIPIMSPKQIEELYKNNAASVSYETLITQQGTTLGGSEGGIEIGAVVSIDDIDFISTQISSGQKIPFNQNIEAIVKAYKNYEVMENGELTKKPLTHAKVWNDILSSVIPGLGKNNAYVSFNVKPNMVDQAANVIGSSTTTTNVSTNLGAKDIVAVCMADLISKNIKGGEKLMSRPLEMYSNVGDELTSRNEKYILAWNQHKGDEAGSSFDWVKSDGSFSTQDGEIFRERSKFFPNHYFDTDECVFKPNQPTTQKVSSEPSGNLYPTGEPGKVDTKDIDSYNTSVLKKYNTRYKGDITIKLSHAENQSERKIGTTRKTRFGTQYWAIVSGDSAGPGQSYHLGWKASWETRQWIKDLSKEVNS